MFPYSILYGKYISDKKDIIDMKNGEKSLFDYVKRGG